MTGGSRPAGADDAVHGPGRDVVGRVAEVCAGVDVVVLGGDDVVPRAGRAGGAEIAAATAGAASDGQRAALAEVVLHVDDDQGAGQALLDTEPQASGREPPGRRRTA